MSSLLVDADVALDSLAGIEGYEFLSDLDVGFEEELKSRGVNPSAPTAAKPGSEEKVMMLAARYAAGLPLWHNDDCYDHGPGSVGRLIVDDLAAAAAKSTTSAPEEEFELA